MGCEDRTVLPLKTLSPFRRWLIACFLLSGLAGWARADFVVAVEKRQITVSPSPPNASEPASSPPPETVHYVLLTHDQSLPPGPSGITLLIGLPENGDHAANFATMFMGLMRGHANLVVAVPEAPTPGPLSNAIGIDDIVNALVADLVAHDHVNPNHLILLGYSQGAVSGAYIVKSHPGLFAGFASISSGISLGDANPLFDPSKIKGNPGKLALYVSEGANDNVSARTFAFSLAALRYYGFTHVLAERTPGGHALFANVFEPVSKRIMAYFDAVLAENDKLDQKAAPAAPKDPPLGTPANVVVASRDLALPKASYLCATPDRSTVPAPHPSTLLICFHGPGDTAADFMQNWLDLVGSRSDVVVASPLSSGFIDARVVKAIIGDIVARDQVNPRHIIVVGHDWGALEAAYAFSSGLESFAGFAGISADLDPRLFTDAGMKRMKRLPVYYAVGKKDAMFQDVFAANVAQFKSAGFSRVLAESPDAGHALSPDEIKNMMLFFDKELAAQDKSTATNSR